MIEIQAEKSYKKHFHSAFIKKEKKKKEKNLKIHKRVPFKNSRHERRQWCQCRLHSVKGIFFVGVSYNVTQNVLLFSFLK